MENYEARKAHIFTILQNLHKALPKSAHIKEVQKVAFKLALIPNNVAVGQDILQQHSKICKVLEGGVVKKEERWTIAVIPDVLTSIICHKGDPLKITEEMTKTEVQMLLGIHLE